MNNLIKDRYFIGSVFVSAVFAMLAQTAYAEGSFLTAFILTVISVVNVLIAFLDNGAYQTIFADSSKTSHVSNRG